MKPRITKKISLGIELNFTSLIRSEISFIMLPLLDAFRTLNWRKVEDEFRYFSNFLGENSLITIPGM
jgi:hypothetical protein